MKLTKKFRGELDMEIHAVSKTYVYPTHNIDTDKYWIMKWADQGLFKLI